MKDIIIFGAGEKGYSLAQRVGRERVRYFCDNSAKKTGKTLMGIPIISFDSMREMGNLYDIILSTGIEDMRRQLVDADMRFWEGRGFQNNYFLREEVKTQLDEKLMERFLHDKDLLSFMFEREKENGYRFSYYNEENRKLVEFMRSEEQEKALDLLRVIYADEKEMQIQFDEWYDIRPGLRLIRHIIDFRQESGKKALICDLACGHGELLLRLKEEGHQVFGVEVNEDRMRYCREKGIECRTGSVDRTDYADDMFDYVICTECLEHVANPSEAVKEIKRILAYGGMAFVTVPFGWTCDCNTHVRQYDASDMYTLFLREGFDIVNMMRIPYIDTNIRKNNIFVCAGKKSE